MHAGTFPVLFPVIIIHGPAHVHRRLPACDQERRRLRRTTLSAGRRPAGGQVFLLARH